MKRQQQRRHDKKKEKKTCDCACGGVCDIVYACVCMEKLVYMGAFIYYICEPEIYLYPFIEGGTISAIYFDDIEIF